jgi:hypothetical protein
MMAPPSWPSLNSRTKPKTVFSTELLLILIVVERWYNYRVVRLQIFPAPEMGDMTGKVLNKWTSWSGV